MDIYTPGRCSVNLSGLGTWQSIPGFAFILNIGFGEISDLDMVRLWIGADTGSGYADAAIVCQQAHRTVFFY